MDPVSCRIFIGIQSFCMCRQKLSQNFSHLSTRNTNFSRVPHPFLSKTSLRLLHIKPYTGTEKPAYAEFGLKKNLFLSEYFSHPNIL
jgi:hypothetical protein